MAVFGTTIGLTNAQATELVSAAFALIGGAFAIRERVKSVHIDWKGWISSKNTWNYLFAVVAFFVPLIPAGIGDKIADIATAIFSKNWAALLPSLVSLGTIIYFWITGGKSAAKNKATQ